MADLLRAKVPFAVGRRVYPSGAIFTTTDPIVAGRSELFEPVQPTYPTAGPAEPVKRPTRKPKTTTVEEDG